MVPASSALHRRQERRERLGQGPGRRAFRDHDAVAGGEGFRGDRRGGDVGQAGGQQLEEVLAVPQVLQAVLAQVAQIHAFRQVVADHLLGGQREQHLAAVAG